MSRNCSVCSSNKISPFRQVGEYNYYRCGDCDVLFLSPDVLDKIDSGMPLKGYDNQYWREELKASRERSWGSGLARVAETLLYARLPVKRFIDIGSGPGYLLDALAYQLPSSKDIFYGQELFPPAIEFRTKLPNYREGKLDRFEFPFDAGCCIEVVEHLTPSMVKGLFRDLAAKSKKNSIYLFNTGLSSFIEFEDPGYLDPHVRGHIMGWSVKAIRLLAAPLGFEILPIRGKTWAFMAEFKPDHGFDKPLEERIWYSLPENKQILTDPETGNLLYGLGLDTVRAYLG